MAVVALAGCGGSNGEPRTVAGVRQALHRLVDDLISGDTAGACSLFTPAALQHTFGGQAACQQLLALAAKTPGEKAKLEHAARQIDTAPITVHGDIANVPRATGGGTSSAVYVNGRWLFGASPSQQTSTATTG